MKLVSASRRAATLVASSLMACGSSSETHSTTGPEQACLDVADAVAKAAERCKLASYKDTYDAFVNGATGNKGCGAVVQIRDENALRTTCIPSFATISCADLAAVNLNASCRSQLLRPASLDPHPGPASLAKSISAVMR